MDNNNQAIRPSYFSSFRDLKVEKDISEDDLTLEDQAFYRIAKSDDWHFLKQYIYNLIEGIESVNHKAMEAGASFEEIGRNTITIQLCKEQLLNVINRVEDVRDSRDTK